MHACGFSQGLTGFNADPPLLPALEDLGSSLQVSSAALDVALLQLEARGALGLLHGLVGWRSCNWGCSHVAFTRSPGWRMRKRRGAKYSFKIIGTSELN